MRAGTHGPFNWNVPHFCRYVPDLSALSTTNPVRRRAEREETESGGVEKRTVADGRREVAQGRGGERGGESEGGCYEATDLRSSWSGMYCE